MSEQYPGGYITKSPVVPTSVAAPGIWTLSQQAKYQSAGTWPTPIPVDFQFNYVTMLLHGDGTNAAQNNTFVDSSSYSTSMTRVGDLISQGSFGPFGPNWSNYFPDSGSNNSAYLGVAISGTLATAMSGSSQTREFWINRTSTIPSQASLLRVSGGDYGTIYFTSGNLVVYNGGAIISVSAATYVPVGVWTHVAVVQNAGTVTLYVNGINVGTSSSTISSAGTTLQIGGANDMLSVGYMSNVRISSTARYTSNFTPSATNFTSDGSTALLCCQSSRYLDTSSVGNTLSVTGAPSVQRYNPFGESTAYSASVTGGSIQNITQNNYLTCSNTQFNFGASDWTVEFFLYYAPAEVSGSYGTFFDNGGQGLFLSYGPSSASLLLYSSSAQPSASGISHGMQANTWNHVAFVRSSGTVGTIYVNGSSIGTVSISGSMNPSGSTAYVGTYSGAPNTYWPGGYMSSFRVVTGTAVYTSNFTPPTAPLSTRAGCTLLLNAQNGAIYDNAEIATLTTSGTAAISTSVKKYGNGSLSFDGSTGCYILSNAATGTNLYAMGSGDFTVEMWIYVNSFGAGLSVLIDTRNGTNTDAFVWYVSSAGLLNFYVGGGDQITSSTLSVTTWYHIAVSRSGTSTKMFVNGTQAGSTYTDTNVYTCGAQRPILGANGYVPGTFATSRLNGYIDDLRITKGYARYTTNFTPPTAAFPNLGPTA